MVVYFSSQLFYILRILRSTVHKEGSTVLKAHLKKKQGTPYTQHTLTHPIYLTHVSYNKISLILYYIW